MTISHSKGRWAPPQTAALVGRPAGLSFQLCPPKASLAPGCSLLPNPGSQEASAVLAECPG